MNIKLSNSDLEAIIDDSNFDLVKDFKWRLMSGYAITDDVSIHRRFRRALLMHRLILKSQLKDGFFVDHINRNRLDNRIINLRVIPIYANGINREKPKKKTSSRFKCVLWYKAYQKWQVQVTAKGKKYNGGYYSDEIEAAKKTNILMKRYQGEFAVLNPV